MIIALDSNGIVKSGSPNEIIPNYIKNEKSNIELDTLNPIDTLNASANDKQHIIEQLKTLTAEQQIEKEEEEKEEGYISLKVYRKYCLAVGVCLTFFTLASLFFMQTSKNLTDLWLSYWTEHHSSSNSTFSIKS